jgi:Secretion system C-terminal sorting domain
MFLNDKVFEINALYNVGLNLWTVNPGGTGSDHASFWAHNYSAIFLIEDGWDFNPNYHTINDLVQYINPEFFLKFSQLGIGTLADLALASFYGTIISINSYVDKTYARKNIDSVLFLTKFNNVYSHPFTTNLIYSNNNRTQVDSLSLFDDGLHGDSLSNDGIYGACIPPQPYENNYILDVSTVDLQTNKYFLTPNISSFTTAGPVVLDSIVYLKTSYASYCRPFITNKGDSILHNVTGKLICNDPWVTNINPSTWTIQNLPPEVSTGSSGLMVLSIIDSLFPGYFNFKAQLGRDNWPYWEDSILVIVGVENEISLPTEFSLFQNFPNPFNPNTTIKYSIPEMNKVSLAVFNLLGEEVATLVNEEKVAGYHEIEFNASVLSSGIYFYRLQAGDFISTKKMILLK